MDIRLNREKERELYDLLRKDTVAESREGIHVSDLLYLRKAYWSRVLPKPPTNDEIALWLAGKAHHYFLVRAVAHVDDSQEASLYNEEFGIHYSPDLVQLQGEFKTSRRWAVPKTQQEAMTLAGYYEHQCRMYAALSGVKQWGLYVLYLSPKDRVSGKSSPKFKVYDLFFTDEEIEETKQEMKAGVAALERATADKDHTKLPLCPQKFCFQMKGRGKKRAPVAICKYFTECNPLNEDIGDLP